MNKINSFQSVQSVWHEEVKQMAIEDMFHRNKHWSKQHASSHLLNLWQMYWLKSFFFQNKKKDESLFVLQWSNLECSFEKNGRCDHC